MRYFDLEASQGFPLRDMLMVMPLSFSRSVYSLGILRAAVGVMHQSGPDAPAGQRHP